MISLGKDKWGFRQAETTLAPGNSGDGETEAREGQAFISVAQEVGGRNHEQLLQSCVLWARGWQHHDMDQAQGLLGNGRGSVWSEVTTGQRQHGVATPRRKKWQPGGQRAMPGILFGGGR